MRLRIGGLIGRRIRHGYGSAVHQAHRAVTPMPRALSRRRHPLSGGTRQGAHHWRGQACACPAIGPGMRAAWRQTARQPLHRRVVHRLLAGSIGVECLRQKHRQCLGRRKQPLPMLGQQRLDFVEQVRPGQQIEKRMSVAHSRLSTNLLSNLTLLPRTRFEFRMHLGWLLE